MDFILNSRWRKYGLCIADYLRRSELEIARAENFHNLVVDYLERHPKASEKYGSTGFQYYDILALAEKEAKANGL